MFRSITPWQVLSQALLSCEVKGGLWWKVPQKKLVDAQTHHKLQSEKDYGRLQKRKAEKCWME